MTTNKSLGKTLVSCRVSLSILVLVSSFLFNVNAESPSEDQWKAFLNRAQIKSLDTQYVLSLNIPPPSKEVAEAIYGFLLAMGPKVPRDEASWSEGFTVAPANAALGFALENLIMLFFPHSKEKFEVIKAIRAFWASQGARERGLGSDNFSLLFPTGRAHHEDMGAFNTRWEALKLSLREYLEGLNLVSKVDARLRPAEIDFIPTDLRNEAIRLQVANLGATALPASTETIRRKFQAESPSLNRVIAAQDILVMALIQSPLMFPTLGRYRAFSGASIPSLSGGLTDTPTIGAAFDGPRPYYSIKVVRYFEDSLIKFLSTLYPEISPSEINAFRLGFGIFRRSFFLSPVIHRRISEPGLRHHVSQNSWRLADKPFNPQFPMTLDRLKCGVEISLLSTQ